MVATKTNSWREHVKKTMALMKAKSSGKTVMLKDVLKQAGKTYKKSGTSAVAKTHKKGKKGGKKTAKKGGKKGRSRKSKKSSKKGGSAAGHAHAFSLLDPQ